MWARIVEVMLGLWLLLSPFIFRHYPGPMSLWINDWITGTAIVLVSFAAFAPRLNKFHLLNVPIALWLMGFAWVFGGYPADPGYQNQILVGLILIIFAIIPNEASQPPPGWREFYRREAERAGR